jgi:hypothetical protein
MAFIYRWVNRTMEYHTSEVMHVSGILARLCGIVLSKIYVAFKRNL